jgi:hypothetical protein
MILEALEFTANKHRGQFRKGANKTPKINHTIQVAYLHANEGGEKNPILILVQFCVI